MASENAAIISLLESSFLFCGLDSLQLHNLSEQSKLYTYHTGEILIEEGIINDRFILILDGLVKIYKTTLDGKEIFLAIEKTHDYLGVMDLTDKPSSANIEALQTTAVLSIKKKDLITVLQKNPYLWEKMYKIVISKMEEYRYLQSIRLSNNLQQRTYLLLKHLSQFSRDNAVMLSHESIASIVGATRPRVTETLNALQDIKKITIFPKKITLLA